jgi:AraC-like DNA-binding protein
MSDVLFVVSIAFCVLSLLFGIVLLFYNTENRNSNRLIVLGLISIVITVYFNVLLRIPSVYLSYPYLWRLGIFTQYLSAPCFFLYVKLSLSGREKLRKIELLHFLPAFLHLIEFMPFYFMPIGVKKEYLVFLFSQPEKLFQHGEGFLSIDLHLFFKLGFALVYQFFQLRLLVVHRRGLEIISKNKLRQWKWLVWFTVFFSMTVVYFVILFLFYQKKFFFSYVVFGYLFFLATLVIMLLFNPGFLYGMKKSEAFEKEEPKDEEEAEIFVSSGRFLSEKKTKKYKEKLDKFVCKKKPFLIKNYSIVQLSTDCQIPIHDLSVLINQEYGCNFNNFINNCRVNYIIVHRFDKGWNAYTLEAIGLEAGFNSRSSFFKAFKKRMEVSPKVFFEQHYKLEFLHSAAFNGCVEENEEK